jgi:hypothetical protein
MMCVCHAMCGVWRVRAALLLSTVDLARQLARALVDGTVAVALSLLVQWVWLFVSAVSLLFSPRGP